MPREVEFTAGLGKQVHTANEALRAAAEGPLAAPRQSSSGGGDQEGRQVMLTCREYSSPWLAVSIADTKSGRIFMTSLPGTTWKAGCREEEGGGQRGSTGGRQGWSVQRQQAHTSGGQAGIGADREVTAKTPTTASERCHKVHSPSESRHQSSPPLPLAARRTRAAAPLPRRRRGLLWLACRVPFDAVPKGVFTPQGGAQRGAGARKRTIRAARILVKCWALPGPSRRVPSRSKSDVLCAESSAAALGAASNSQVKQHAPSRDACAKECTQLPAGNCRRLAAVDWGRTGIRAGM